MVFHLPLVAFMIQFEVTDFLKEIVFPLFISHDFYVFIPRNSFIELVNFSGIHVGYIIWSDRKCGIIYKLNM